jgi:hypothetical protein
MNEELKFLKRAVKKFEDPAYIERLRKELEEAPVPSFSYLQPERLNPEASKEDAIV